MPELTTERMRQMLDAIDAEAKETQSESRLEQLEKELAELKTRIATLPDEIQAQLAPTVRETAQTVSEEQAELDESQDSDQEPVPRVRTRAGRKRGQVYQDRPGEPAYVYDGDDEPDRVPLDDDEDDEE